MPNASTGSNKAFVDTNVFIYAHDRRDPSKQASAQSLIERLVDDGGLITSTQVLNEICAVLLRKNIAPAQTIPDVADMVAELAAIAQIATVTVDTTLQALSVVESDGLSWFDALIWAAAKQSGATILYSEDFQHGRLLQGVTFINPFVQ